MPTLTGGAASQVAAASPTALVWAVDVTPVTSGAAISRWATRRIAISGQEYQAKLLGDPTIAGGGMNPGDVIPGAKSVSLRVSDLDHAIAQAPAGAATTAYWMGATMVVRCAFVGAPETARAWVFICTGTQDAEGAVTFVGVDLLNVQEVASVPRGTIDRATFSRAPEDAIGRPIPVVYGRAMVPLTLVDTDADEAGLGSVYLVGYGTYTIHALYQRGIARTGYSQTTMGSGASIMTIIRYTSRAIYDAAGRAVEMWADVTRTDGVATYGAGNRGNPANVLADLWTQTEYGLGRSSALLDATTFGAAANAWDAAGQLFRCSLRASYMFSTVLQNLLTSCAARIRVNDKLYLYRRGSEPAAPITLDDTVIIAHEGVPSISIADRDMQSVYNERTFLYEDATRWGSQGPSIEEATYIQAASQSTIGRREGLPFRSLFIGTFAMADWAVFHGVDLIAAAMLEVTVTVGLAGLQIDEGETVFLDWPARWPEGAQQLTVLATQVMGQTVEIRATTPGDGIYSANSAPPDQTPLVTDTYNLIGRALLGDSGIQGAIRSHDKSGYNNGTPGIWIGRSAGNQVQFEIFSDVSQYIRWDSTSGLTLKGSATLQLDAGSSIAWGDVTGSPSYLGPTYISATEIRTPHITTGVGDISSELRVGGPTTGIRLIGSTGDIQSSSFTAGSAGWRIRTGGDVEFNSGTFRGTLSAASGTFTGALSGASGTFTGTVDVSATYGRVRINPNETFMFELLNSTGDLLFTANTLSGSSGVTGQSFESTDAGVTGNGAVSGSYGLKGSAATGSIPLFLQTIATNGPHFRIYTIDGERTSSPNGVVSSSSGDAMFYRVGAGGAWRLAMCQGGTVWNDI